MCYKAAKCICKCIKVNKSFTVQGLKSSVKTWVTVINALEMPQKSAIERYTVCILMYINIFKTRTHKQKEIIDKYHPQKFSEAESISLENVEDKQGGRSREEG